MDPRRDPESTEYDARVLKNFVDREGRLDGIPAQHKKRLAVLRWLVEDFQPGRSYSEAEVNDVIPADTRTSRRSAVTSWTRSSCNAGIRSTGEPAAWPMLATIRRPGPQTLVSSV